MRCFLKLHRDYHLWCPVCRSLHRHRLGWLFLNSPWINIRQSPRRMLHIAPESFSALLNQIAGLDYLTADRYDRRAMVQMDICDIQYPERSFDLIYCSHVLEHVLDDRQAMREFWRVLRPGGQAVIQVPIMAETTVEDPAVVDPYQRLRLFGQFDHVRSYGKDFPQRLEQADFQVTVLYTEELAAPAEIVRQGLPPGGAIYLAQRELL